MMMPFLTFSFSVESEKDGSNKYWIHVQEKQSEYHITIFIFSYGITLHMTPPMTMVVAVVGVSSPHQSPIYGVSRFRSAQSITILLIFLLSSKSVPASTRLEDPSRKGTTRTAKSAPLNPCPRERGLIQPFFR